MPHKLDTIPAPAAAPVPPVSTVRKYYELVDAGDVRGLVGLFAPDARYYRPGYPPLVGHDELELFYHEQRVIREGAHVLSTVVAAGSDVAVHGEFKGVLRDGRRVTARFADFFAITPDGRFARRDTFFFSPLI
jgi:steroid Delta-isomerase